MSAGEWIGIGAGVLSAVLALVALTRYLSQLPLKLEIGQFRDRLNTASDKYQSELDRHRERYQDLESKYQDLARQVAVSRRRGTEALIQKQGIDEEFRAALHLLQV